MRHTTTVLVALAAMGSLELFAAGTPIASVQFAQAQDLGPSLQFKLKKLAKTINKTRGSLASQGAAAIADDFKAKQWQQRIDSYKSGLSRYPANTDATFAAAKAELTALEQEFAALKGGAAATPAPAQSTETPAAAAPAAQASKLDSSALIKLNALTSNMDRTRKQILSNGVTTLQTPEGQAKIKKDLAGYVATLQAYKAHAKDPAVQPAVQSYKALVVAVQETFAKAKQANSAGNEVQAELAALDKAMRANKAPKSLLAPFTEAEAKTWIDRTREVKATAQRVMNEVNRIGGSNPLPIVQGTVDQGTPYDKQDIQRLYSNSQMQIRRTDEAIAETERNFSGGLRTGAYAFEMKFLRELDPENPNHRSNVFLKEGAETERYAQIDNLIAMAKSYEAYERLSTGEASAETKTDLAEIIALRKEYAVKRMQAIGDSKLPEPKSTDAKRLEIAKAILDTPKYAFDDAGPHGPIVLTTPEVVTKEKTVTRETIKDVDVSLSGDITWSGTRETWNYKWDEFRFATPIQDEGGDWYIWWITAKNFASGADSTPLNRWISGAVVKGDLILEKNFK